MLHALVITSMVLASFQIGSALRQPIPGLATIVTPPVAPAITVMAPPVTTPRAVIAFTATETILPLEAAGKITDPAISWYFAVWLGLRPLFPATHFIVPRDYFIIARALLFTIRLKFTSVTT